MRQFWQLIKDYLAALPVFIITFYFITAEPDGKLIVHLTGVNSWLIISYLAIYPFVMSWYPHWRKNRLVVHSYDAQQRSHNAYLTGSRLAGKLALQDDLMNLAVFWFWRGLLMVFAMPIALSYGAWYWYHHRG